MELKPNTENVVYLDEYPELQKKVRLRRLAQQRLGQMALSPEDPGWLVLLLFPEQEGDPNGAD